RCPRAGGSAVRPQDNSQGAQHQSAAAAATGAGGRVRYREWSILPGGKARAAAALLLLSALLPAAQGGRQASQGPPRGLPTCGAQAVPGEGGLNVWGSWSRVLGFVLLLSALLPAAQGGGQAREGPPRGVSTRGAQTVPGKGGLVLFGLLMLHGLLLCTLPPTHSPSFPPTHPPSHPPPPSHPLIRFQSQLSLPSPSPPPTPPLPTPPLPSPLRTPNPLSLSNQIRPIDKKLQYQIEKLLKLASSANRGTTPGKQSAAAAEAGVGGSLDDLKHRPNPNLLVSKLGGSGSDGGEDGGVAAGLDGAGGGGGAGGIYKPPKIAPMAMDGEKEGGKKGGEVGARREEREMREARRRAARSAFVKELAEDVEGRPREMRVEGASTMMVEGKEMEREVERLRERAAAEEKMFSRVPLNRGEKQRLKALKRSQNMLAGMLDDFDDDIAGIMAAGEEGAAQAGLTAAAGAAAGGIGGLTSAGMLESLLRPRKLSEAIHEAGKITSLRGAQGKVISGDADLPLKPDLGERRRAYEAGVVAKQVRKRGSEDLGFDQGDEDGGEGEGGEGGEEDEFYAEARKMQEARRSAKAAKYSSSGLIPEAEPSVDEDGRRQITNQIERNRGLTAHRNKAVKNPRKKYK
ncbi:unnamed protein product, partial [Closterium sp. NIES-53]